MRGNWTTPKAVLYEHGHSVLPEIAYVPLGGGARQCIGNTFAMMEAVLILLTMAQRFRSALRGKRARGRRSQRLGGAGTIESCPGREI